MAVPDWFCLSLLVVTVKFSWSEVMLRKLLMSSAVALGVVSVASHAEARQWFMLNVAMNQCDLEPVGTNPDGFDRYMRHSTEYMGVPRIDIRHINGDTLVEIDATFANGQNVWYFFSTSYPSCESFRRYMLSQGKLLSRSELQ